MSPPDANDDRRAMQPVTLTAEALCVRDLTVFGAALEAAILLELEDRAHD